ncbi:large ribosomal subunit protein uL18m-like [Clavelina lepadiformis]|uniref:large ribosomal subunit protein uL18m-like n=1 Tax=Clavelina lepadiformis TaxID=159417 RepID=UPI00404183B0
MRVMRLRSNLIPQSLKSRHIGLTTVFCDGHQSLPSSTTEQDNAAEETNLNVNLVKTFINRNPRNLERLALAHKDIGWGRGRHHVSTNFPKREYYHRICLERTNQHTHAWLEHYAGNKVAEASTKDWKVRKHLYKTVDVSASACVASVLMEKCIRSGFSCAQWFPLKSTEGSEVMATFRDTIQKTGFVLEEPVQVTFRRKLPHHKRYGPSPPKQV